MPLTRSVVFVERPVEELVDFVLWWEGRWIVERTGCAPQARRVEGDLRGA